MKTLYRSFLQTFKSGGGNITKILLLASGLAMGLVLIAKVYFEQTYDSYVPDVNRVYKVIAQYNKNGEEPRDLGSTSGAIAPGIKEYSPAVEVATRYSFFDNDKVSLKHILPSGDVEDGSCWSDDMIYVDSCFFDIFQRKIYVGDGKRLMQQKNTLMVSRSFAEKLKDTFLKSGKKSSNDVVGMVLAPGSDLSQKFTVGGVFEDFPKNSILAGVDVLLSLPTIITPNWDGTKNWLGNDRYRSYVKLHKGVDVKNVREGIVKMCNERIPKGMLEKWGITVDFRLASLASLHTEDPDISRMCNMLSLLAIIVFVAAVLNYILIAISSMVSKAKVVAVHKCYGASNGNIYRMALSDTLAHLMVSLALAIVIVLMKKNMVEDLMDAPISSLFIGNSLFLLLLICIVIFFVCGVVPGYLYAKVPIATAFRGYRENSRKWKLSLLFVQFIASVFFISLLLVVSLQYNSMLNIDMGYNTKNVIYIEEKNISENVRLKLKHEFKRLPFVKNQAFCSILPFHGYMSGNDIMNPGEDVTILNICDMYGVDAEYLNVLEVPIVAGSTFDELSSTKQVMVTQSFVDKMKELEGWDDNVVGRQIRVGEHDKINEVHTIRGVYKGYMLGTILKTDDRPVIQVFGNNEANYLKELMSIHIIRLTDMSSEHLNEINMLLDKFAPNSELEAKLVADEYAEMFVDSRRFRDSVLIAGLVVLFIALIGLIGYLRDEVNRRRSEIAIRKINGATMPVLLSLFVRSVMIIAVPAVVLGCICGYLAADRWLEQFTEKIDLSWWIFVGSGLFALILVVVVVLCSTYKAANANPVENLKCE